MRSSFDRSAAPGIAGTPDAARYVLTKMWGLQTEPALAPLADAFPDAKVTFRRADTGDE